MQLRRYITIVDLGIFAVLAVALVLPPRGMDVAYAAKGTDADRFSLALAEARTLAHPSDGAPAADFSRRLGEAGFNDWAIDSAVAASQRTMGTPNRWRALLAASVAFVDRQDAKEALELVDVAVNACESAGETACPDFEKQPILLYQESLRNGIASKIDPHVNPKAFRKASRLPPIHVGPVPNKESTPVKPGRDDAKRP